MSTPAHFEVDESTRLDALLLVARHLRRHPLLPDPHRMTVDLVWQRIRLHLLSEPDKELRDLLTWHDSLRLPQAEIWRTACGTRVVANVLGHTDDGLPIEVFIGLDYDKDLFTVAVEPDGGRSMDRIELELAGAEHLRRIARHRNAAGAVIDGLTNAQADGLACVICGADYLRVRLAHVPAGRSAMGSQVFACVGRCAALARAEYPAGGDAR
jgi:hypothetical protein